MRLGRLSGKVSGADQEYLIDGPGPVPAFQVFIWKIPAAKLVKNMRSKAVVSHLIIVILLLNYSGQTRGK
jgi:hypothetical protein